MPENAHPTASELLAMPLVSVALVVPMLTAARNFSTARRHSEKVWYTSTSSVKLSSAVASHARSTRGGNFTAAVASTIKIS